MIESKLFTTEQRAEWGDGPWQHEPDKLQWKDEATGLPCLIVRSPIGSLCGYVGVYSGHALYEKNYNDVNLDAHGGLTFSDHCHEGGSICHLPEPGEPEPWWFGFDTAHAGDFVPSMRRFMMDMPKWRGEEDRYRDVAYVREEVRLLAQQLKAVVE